MHEASTIRRIKDAVASGESYYAVAKREGVNPSTVRYWTDTAYQEGHREKGRRAYHEKPGLRASAKSRAKSFHVKLKSLPLGHPRRVKTSLAALNSTLRQRGQPEVTEDYELIAAAHTGACAICGLPAELCKRGRLEIDHCHDTGAFRGWLCGKCNSAIGYVSDDPDLLRKAASYLEENRHARR